MLLHGLYVWGQDSNWYRNHVNVVMSWRCEGIIMLFWDSVLRTLLWIECWLVVEWLDKPKDRKAGPRKPGCWVVVAVWVKHVGVAFWAVPDWPDMGTSLGIHIIKSFLIYPDCGCNSNFLKKLPLSKRLVCSLKHWYFCIDLYDSFVIWTPVLLRLTDLELGLSGSYCQRLQI